MRRIRNEKGNTYIGGNIAYIYIFSQRDGSYQCQSFDRVGLIKYEEQKRIDIIVNLYDSRKKSSKRTI